MENKIKIGVSSCLLGEKVRWNGDHKQDHYVRNIFGHYFEYVPTCPEVDVGMGIPRETVALYGTLYKPRMIGNKTKTDWTDKINKYTKGRINELINQDLCGYIFKAKSPSCGIGRVNVYSEFGSSKVRYGAGIFARAFIKSYPLVPVEDEGRLHDARIKENFIIRVFCFNRIGRLLRQDFTIGKLVKFHTKQKFLLLSHSRKHYDALCKLVANAKKYKLEELKAHYCETFMDALTYKSTTKKNTDVLLHMMGFLKKILTEEEKENILATIEDYRNELLPIIVPITLIKHQVKIHKIDYLLDQVYLNPHPKELMLRNHV